MPKNIAFIPVRGGSKSIPLKNIRPICGRPLVYWVAAACSACSKIDHVAIATDSTDIRTAVESFALPKVQVVERSAASATDGASTESAMLEYAETHDFDTMVLVQATSPLLTSSDLDNGFTLYESAACDSVLSVVRDKRFYWKQHEDSVMPINYDVFARPRRQDFDGLLMENGAFYITSRERLLQTKNRVSGRILASIMPEDTGFEIDEPNDWVIIEQLLARRLATEQGQPDFSAVRLVLTDCDGCLTDAGMYYAEDGAELKKFNTRDGMAFALLREAGIKVGIITGENSAAAKRRGEKLHADYIVTGCSDKLTAIKDICREEGIELEHVAYIGDDRNDAEALGAVGVPCCPADAQPQARIHARYIACAKGGKGVIREIAEHILSTRKGLRG